MDKNVVREMVERISWFSPVDYEIMMFFEDHDILASPNVIAKNTDYNRQYISKRCGELTRADLLENPEKGIYQLSEKGRSFLSGEVDSDEIEQHG